MPSLQSRLFIFTLKYRHLLRGQLKRRSIITFDTSIPQLREEIERGAGFFGKLPASIELLPVKTGAFSDEWMISSCASRDRAILYFHRGGYATGSITAHRPIVSKFVTGTGLPALVFNYRLAPEHPFPAAAVVLSPWTDVKNTGDSWYTNAKVDTLTWQEAQIVFSRYYAADTDPGHPWISPLYGDLHGLPPLLIFVGGHELLRDDSTRFAEKAKEAGVDVTLRVGEGLFHCYPACAPLFPEARQAMEEKCLFVEGHLKRSDIRSVL